MRHIALWTLTAVVAACGGANERASDSAGPAAIDTLKPATVTDTLASDTTATKTPATKAPATKTKSGTGTKLGRDSAIQAPNLPQLDTVKSKRPPRRP
jgi:hypothetical protein